MSKNFNDIPSDPDALAIQLLEISARKELDQFLGMFRKDFAVKIDFGKGYGLLDDDLPHYVSKSQLNQPYAFTLFVRATLKTGKPTRFILHTVWMGELKFAVGIAEVPDNVVDGYHVPLNWN